MRRVTSTELLDEDRGNPREIETSLDDLWRINRWLGGVSGSLRLLRLFFQKTGVHELRLLDVGAGDARMTNHLGGQLRRDCPGTQLVALDRRLSHLQNCPQTASDARYVTADVMKLPFPPASFDVVTCNLFLHHFSGAAAVELLRILLATAREAVLINDLERKWLSYWIIACAPWIARSSMTRFDGRASVRQAYTRTELQALAAESGAARAEVIDLPFFRLGLLLWKQDVGASA
jgi:2-polyprenyl-3-methyl-5-hydroxy-6-metoxy-1,4-benzoquinol methylase